MTAWTYDDGGRTDAGFRGHAGDCVTRAIAIAAELPYREVYDDLFALIRVRNDIRRSKGRAVRRRSSPREGVSTRIEKLYLETQLGWTWTPTMFIGSGCRVHLRAEELPAGRIVVKLSRHSAAVVDGVVHDTYDPSRDGTRCVYGYWTAPA